MNSKDYWSAREAEQLKHYIADEKEHDKQINQIYENMLEGAMPGKEGHFINEAKNVSPSLIWRPMSAKWQGT